MMPPSAFTKECAYIAHIALKQHNPMSYGIEYGIKSLKYKRAQTTSSFGFDPERFDKHVELYLPVVKQMVESYLEYGKSDLRK